ncbi:S8 family peptidase [Mycolicibacter icosiumassiliensis]|uniref:S8 family peptidase n=1 Tax=Mycolicibacter icosiumassiliensis TaxID=1792835 RepID=UPI000830505C|nr:S8 family peptidase [Mycolicibacter icosiumassiliensis]
MTTPQSAVRPLLVNGEGLRIEGVEAPNASGGPKFEPRTADDARELLLPQVNVMVASAQALPSQLRAPDRVYVEAKLLPNYLAASYFPGALLAQIGATPVGSRADTGLYVTASKQQEAQTRRLVFTVPDAGLAALQTLVQTGGANRTERQAFSEIRKLDEIAIPRPDQVLRTPPAPEDTLAHPSLVWEAVLHPATARSGEAVALEQETLARWISLVQSRGGQVHEGFIRRVGGLTFVPLTAGATEAAELARFNPLRVLRPMPGIRPRPRFGLRAARRVSPPPTAQPMSTAATVAVFDGGVEGGTSPLFPIGTSDLTLEPAVAEDLSHGTGVTGAVLYGLLEPGQQAPRPPLPVHSYRVTPSPNPHDLEGYWVLDRIVETIRQNGHQIVNLSMGPDRAVDDDMEPDRWTSELDQLAWDNDVLFVVAAGNDGDQDAATGLHRVQVPADMANGLAVGACDAAAPHRPWARADYSSMGPGRHGNRIQPLGVQFGGAESQMFNLLAADGGFLEAAGTSFAAPVTTHALADLTTRLPRVNSSVLRSFATHFAERPHRHVKLRDEVGYGRQPLTYEDLLDCDPDEVHVLYVDEIVRGDLMAYQLPAPSPVTANLAVTLTLAYASPIDPTQPTEYTSASLEMLLRPHHRMHSFRAPTGLDAKPIIADIGSPQAGELLAAGWEASQEPITKQLGAKPKSSEAQLRDSGKWETIRHHRFTLKPTEIAAPRLEITYVARRAGALDNSPTTVPFALLISLSDTGKSGTLYDTVRQQFTTLRPAQRSRARLRSSTASDQIWH